MTKRQKKSNGPGIKLNTKQHTLDDIVNKHNKLDGREIV